MGEVIIQSIFLILLLVFFVFFVIQFFNIFFRGFAPFVSTRPKVMLAVLDELKERLEKDTDKVVIELGCGKAGFLRAMREYYPKAKLIGVEYSFLPMFIARIQNALSKSNLKLIKKNIIDTDISEADVIYCYLNRKTMEALEIKLEAECKNNTIVVSNSFSLPKRDPEKVLEIDGVKEKVYIYKM